MGSSIAGGGADRGVCCCLAGAGAGRAESADVAESGGFRPEATEHILRFCKWEKGFDADSFSFAFFLAGEYRG